MSEGTGLDSQPSGQDREAADNNMTVARGEDVDKSGGKDTQGRSSMEPRGIADQEDNNNNITAAAVGVSLDDPGSKDKLGKNSREEERRPHGVE